MVENIKYINDNLELGISYDWKKIYNRCRKLKIFPEDPAIWNPLTVPVWETKWNLLMSIRSKGKTTNVLLLGLVMHEMYGTVTCILGQTKDSIRPMNSKDTYNIVRQFGYIEKITEGRWNDIALYTGGNWYLRNIDDEGNVIEKDSKIVARNFAISEHLDYKSKVNIPTGDLIVYDEFIAKYYYPNEFIDLSDLISTLARNRQSPVIFMLANTVNKYYQYFNELEIADEIQSMEAGDHIIKESSLGTKVYASIIDPRVNEKKKLFNKLFFGFKNPGLGAITGNTTWSVTNYPHCINSDDQETIFHNCYIFHNNKYINLEIVKNEIGIVINAHWSKKVYDDSIIYTLYPIYDNRFRYKLGTSTSKIDRLIQQLIKVNKIYFATNDVGSFFYDYLNSCKISK